VTESLWQGFMISKTLLKRGEVDVWGNSKRLPARPFIVWFFAVACLSASFAGGAVSVLWQNSCLRIPGFHTKAVRA
jgi:hypothetical protein